MVNNELWAFVMPRTCDVEQIKEGMKTRQPYYAIPSFYHGLDEFPRTQNRKIDRTALREFVGGNSPRPTLSVKRPDEASKERTIITHTSAVAVSASTPVLDGKQTLEPTLPGKSAGKLLRGLRHRILIAYRSLFSLLWISNIAAMLVTVILGIDRDWLSRISCINLTVAVLVRQDFVINTLYTITCSVPKSWPLWIRCRCAKIYHLGGVHSGAASAAVAWYVAALVHSTWRTVHYPEWEASTATLIVSWLTCVLLLIILAASWPSYRKAYHDTFELIHRFVGWTALGLIWVQTMLAINDKKYDRDQFQQLGRMVVSSPNFWLLVVITTSIGTSWFTLRKVNVDVEILSAHAVRLHFDYAVPVNGSFARLSDRPLLEWHSFATIGTPEATRDHPRGFSVIVSNAGNWTKHKIQHPPTKIWVRGVPSKFSFYNNFWLHYSYIRTQ
jgi:hypothetical protein